MPMSQAPLHPLPLRDPIGGGDLYVSELRNDESGIRLAGRFEIPRYSRLDAEQHHFLETFLRCRGILSGVEKELGISYPTVRGRLDGLLDTLGLRETKEAVAEPTAPQSRMEIIEQLERGEIDAAEAKRRLGVKQSEGKS
jgi:hypothetical protein